MRKVCSLLVSFGLIFGIATFAFADERGGPIPKRGGEQAHAEVVQQTTITVFIPSRHPYEGHSDFTHDYVCNNGYLGFPFLGVYGVYPGFPFNRGFGFGVGIGF